MNETLDLVKIAKVNAGERIACPSVIKGHQLSALDGFMLAPFSAITLDCFDTLLWRRVDTPIDVFFALQHRPTFKKLGFTADCRVKCEDMARKRQWVKHGLHEVTLTDIYRAFSPDLSEATIAALMEEELAEEMAFCFPYAPMVDLVKRALQAGKTVSIVSDTYFSSEALKRLLSKHLGDSLVNQFSHVIVSSEYGVSKALGLHRTSIQKHRTQSLLHIGDHPVADVKAANEAGIQAIHFSQYEETVKDLRRLSNNSLLMFDPSCRTSTPLFTPFKSLMANKNWEDASDEMVIGYACLGPLMTAFAYDIQAKREALIEQGVTPKLLFLLRDGHLPYRIYTTLFPDATASAVRISRFSSYAASFMQGEQIAHYLAEMISGERYQDMAKQLLFNETEIKQILTRLKTATDKKRAFINMMTTEANTTLITKRSAAYRDRLMRYLEKSAQVEKNETLLLIDLGYSGTTQTKLSPVFKSCFNIDLIGHYLVSLSTPGWQQHRSGLIDPRTADENTLQTLVVYVALLEQLCTTTDKSVVDFDEAGHPILGEANINEDQHNTLTKIQDAATAFAADALRISKTEHLDVHRTALVQTAVSELGRLLFFPTKQELHCLKTFKFDLNLGTSDLFDVFDAEKGLAGLRERGFFFMEKNLKSMRTNYPAELRSAGMELVTTLVSQHRHGLTFKYNDMSYRQRSVTVAAMRGQSSSVETFEAHHTYDGYYSLVIPAGLGDYMAAVVFGERETWVQIHSVTMLPLIRWTSDTESLHTTNIHDHVVYEGMTAHENQLFHCDLPSAALIIKPHTELSHEAMVYRVVFRPVA